MTQQISKIDEKMTKNLDRLVTGDLPEHERERLLAWCAEKPERWRQCALAFLETQTWESVFSNWASSHTSAVSVGNARQVAPTASRRAGWPTMAVVLMVGCFIGAVIRDIGFSDQRLNDRTDQAVPRSASSELAVTPQHNTKAATSQSTSALDTTYLTVPIRTNLGPGIPAELRFAVKTASTGKNEQSPKRAVPEYVRKQWEKRGYQVAQTEKFLNGELPDGEKVVVPVSGLEVKYVGRPVY